MILPLSVTLIDQVESCYSVFFGQLMVEVVISVWREVWDFLVNTNSLKVLTFKAIGWFW